MIKISGTFSSGFVEKFVLDKTEIQLSVPELLEKHGADALHSLNIYDGHAFDSYGMPDDDQRLNFFGITMLETSDMAGFYTLYGEDFPVEQGAPTKRLYALYGHRGINCDDWFCHAKWIENEAAEKFPEYVLKTAPQKTAP